MSNLGFGEFSVEHMGEWPKIWHADVSWPLWIWLHFGDWLLIFLVLTALWHRKTCKICSFLFLKMDWRSGLKFASLIYLDHLQNWFDFGQGGVPQLLDIKSKYITTDTQRLISLVKVVSLFSRKESHVVYKVCLTLQRKISAVSDFLEAIHHISLPPLTWHSNKFACANSL